MQTVCSAAEFLYSFLNTKHYWNFAPTLNAVTSVHTCFHDMIAVAENRITAAATACAQAARAL
eukprot:12675-Heterococcus_DN1.PRE.5